MNFLIKQLVYSGFKMLETFLVNDEIILPAESQKI